MEAELHSTTIPCFTLPYSTLLYTTIHEQNVAACKQLFARCKHLYFDTKLQTKSKIEAFSNSELLAFNMWLFVNTALPSTAFCPNGAGYCGLWKPIREPRDSFVLQSKRRVTLNCHSKPNNNLLD